MTTYAQFDVAFVDTETTGLDPELDHVWEIAVIVDGIEHVWQQRIPSDASGHPDWDTVTPWVLENTGIGARYNHDTALDPAESIDVLANLIGDRHMVGACPWFDSERLHRVNLAHYARESGSRDLPWHYHLIDVETLAVGFLAGRGALLPPLPWKSDELSMAIGVEPPSDAERHTALADARWAKAIYERIMR